MAVLDDFSSNVLFGVGQRKVRSAYSGNIYSANLDGNPYDFGLDGDWLDVAQVNSDLDNEHADGDLTTLYDQSTNGDNFTTGISPVISSSEEVITLTGDAVGAFARPYVQFAGDYIQSTIGGSSAAVTLSMVLKRRGAKVGAYATFGGFVTNYTTAGNYLLMVGGFTNIGEVTAWPGNTTNIAGIADGNYELDNGPTVLTIVKRTSGILDFYVRGVHVARNSRVYTPTLATCVVGGWNGRFANFYFGEALAWSAEYTHEEVATITADQMSGWGIANPASGGGLIRRIPKVIGA